MVWVEFFSISIPLWAILICALIVCAFVWFFIRFTLKLLLFFVVFFALLIILDSVGVFQWIYQNVLTNFL